MEGKRDRHPSKGCRADYNVNFAVNYTDSNSFVNFAENSIDSFPVLSVIMISGYRVKYTLP